MYRSQNLRMLLSDKFNRMENLNRHTDRDQITSPVGNFITVDEDKLKGVCIVIPQSILAKVPHFNKTSVGCSTDARWSLI